MATMSSRCERGAAATVVAILLAAGVLVGMLAVSVDVGNLMWERRQLQNGADASADALAKACAADIAKCDYTTAHLSLAAGGAGLDAINNANATDGANALDSSGQFGALEGLCGANLPAGANMPVCDSATTTADLTDLGSCPSVPSWVTDAGVSYVEAYTRSETSSGGAAVSHFFAPGDTTVSACARYAWGPLTSASVLPLTFRTCEFDEAIATAGYGGETSLPLKYGTDDSCDPTAASSGGDFAGGFGWIDAVGCEAQIDQDGWVDADTGVGKGNECLPEIHPGDTILIPIFDCISDTKTISPACVPGSPTGTNTWYHIDRFEAFYVTGYKITGGGAGVYLPGYPSSGASSECSDESLDNKCLYGWFVEDYVAPEGEIGGSGDGVPAVKPAG